MFSGLMSRWTTPSSWAYCRRQRAGPHHLPQVGPVHVLHDEVEVLVRLAEIVDGDDARVAHPGERPGLAGEPLLEGGPARRLGREDLQRDDPVELHLLCPVDRAHAALADQLEDLELRERPRQLLGCRGNETAARRRGGHVGALQPLLHQALGAEAAGRGVGWDRRAALRALVVLSLVTHGGLHEPVSARDYSTLAGRLPVDRHSPLAHRSSAANRCSISAATSESFSTVWAISSTRAARNRRRRRWTATLTATSVTPRSRATPT